MDRCIDCTATAVKNGRCADCLSEVKETPNWRAGQPGSVATRPPRMKAPAPSIPVRECRYCGLLVPSSRYLQAWCSGSCKDRSLGRDAAACSSPACGKPVKLGGLCITHYYRHKDRLNSERRDAAKRGATEAERISRTTVGIRDQWQCGICHHHVDRSLRYPDPMSPSLDHVVPLSDGGSHTYANVRISHLTCNVSRGNRGYSEQLLLFR